MKNKESTQLGDQDWLENVYQGDKLPELTIKVIVIGSLLGVLVIASNIYMGLKTSFTEGGSIISAILAFAIVKAVKARMSILENNIAQTMASAAASIGIMVSVIPALILLGYRFTGFQLFLWIFFASILGIFFAIPLRRQMVVIENLAFPSGTACATTIRAMHAHGKKALLKAKLLTITGIFSGIITWFRDAIPAVVPYITTFPGKIWGHGLSQLNIGINWSPMLFGVGFLIGPRIGISLLLGSILSWGILAPLLANAQIIEGIGYREISRWTMWVAIALMVSAGFTSLVLRGRIILRAFQSMMGAKYSGGTDIEFPFRFWLVGILIAAVIIAIIMKVTFDVPIWMSLLAIILSYIFAVVAIRAYGETDINPVGTMGHATQMIYGAIAPGKITTNLMAAGIVAAGADQSADMMQDLKAGYLLGATPRKQNYAQFIGATIGAIAAVPIFLAVTGAYGIGTEAMPAPSAVLWSGMAKLLSQGLSTLPKYTGIGVVVSACLGILLTILENTRGRKFTPSPMGMGIAIIVPSFLSLSIFLGSIVRLVLQKRFPVWMEEYSTSLASGGIAGEGIIGVLISILTVSGLL